LDKNKIEILSKDSLYNIQLQVLTLANNKLQEIEKQAIPPTIWFLDLKNNLMTQVNSNLIQNNNKNYLVTISSPERVTQAENATP
jgi:Leucine-rich repeat (LRR) protein